MSNLNDILNHIEATAPCSLFSVASWCDIQLNISIGGFVLVMDALVSSGAVAISKDDSGLVVDLV